MSVLLFGASAFQVTNNAAYRRDWLEQKSLFWQIAWRAPELRYGTSLFATGLPPSLAGVHAAGMLDLLYSGDRSDGGFDYFIFDVDRVVANDSVPSDITLSYKPGAQIAGALRSFRFDGTSSQSLVVWISPGGTLRIVDPGHENEILRCTMLCSNLSQISNPGELISDSPRGPNGPLLRIFGPEPAHDWDYFYQKAELARQVGNWSAVTDLGDQAMRLGLQPHDSSEWFPFIDGEARNGRLGSAENLTNQMLKDCPDSMKPLSALWSEVILERKRNLEETDSIHSALRSKLMLAD
jgi:hypothetical protein